jgi:hypothetical protein
VWAAAALSGDAVAVMPLEDIFIAIAGETFAEL